jgi:PadR family transcriptional regulator PadR
MDGKGMRPGKSVLTRRHYNYFVVYMSDQTLGDFEQIVLLAILRLGENAYGVTIREEITARTDRDPSPGALYNTLARLEEKGLLKSKLGDPTAARGGRAKRFVKLTGGGIDAVTRAQRAYQNLLQGFTLPGLAHG